MSWESTGAAHGIPLNRLASDQRTLAEHRRQSPSRAAKPRRPCDIGLFSDDADQLDLVEMFQQPVEDGL